MGKKNNKNESLGRALIKDRFSTKKGNKAHDNLLHTSDLNDGYDWGRLNLQSVTEQSSFEEFLATAELAGTEFQAEKLNIAFVRPSTFGVPTSEERKKFEKTKEEKKELLKIPRRPKWTASMTGEDLQEAERMSFLEWRRRLALLQEEDGITLTPYEKNLDFWRQLWRVVERSDVVVQIVDARNPLLFRCEDLENYVREVDPGKGNMILLNKADFLTPEQRRVWAKYFDREGMRVAFFSALNAQEEAGVEAEGPEHKGQSNKGTESDGGGSEGESEEEESEEERGDDGGVENEVSGNRWKDIEKAQDAETEIGRDRDRQKEAGCANGGEERGWKNSSELLGREELIDLFAWLLDEHSKKKKNNKEAEEENVSSGASLSAADRGVATIGLVGYPNVGKSSTINALLMDKKVSVSATPGKTKHFQTVFLRDDLMLCDCPGLVMPMMVASRADMILWGILSIDQMRDYEAPVGLLSSLVCSDSAERRAALEAHYSVMIPRPLEGEDPSRSPTARELLDAFAYSRGLMTQNGQPDGARAARLLLKDFVQGRLLHCCSPPGVDQLSFHRIVSLKAPPPRPTAQAMRAVQQMNRMSGEDLDEAFFKKMSLGAHVKGVAKIGSGQSSSVQPGGKSKPWKDHSEKRNKKEKLRRVYRHLDQ